MAVVESLTKARMLVIEAASVVSGYINGIGHLILVKHDTSEIDAGYMIASVPDSSSTVKGIVELATNAEAIAGADTVRAVTPANLAAVAGTFVPSATSTAQGKVELATSAEVSTGTDTTRAITPEALRSAIASLGMVGEIKMWPMVGAPTGWLECQGQSISRTTNAALFAVIVPVINTVTMTIANPAVITLNGHGFAANTKFILTTTGALPSGVTSNSVYYVSATGLTTNTFQFSATQGGASVISTGSQSGTHTLRRCPYGVPDASNFNLPDLRGRTPVGYGLATANGATNHTMGQVFGEETHQLTSAEMPSHRHRPANDYTTGWAATEPQSWTKGATGYVGGTGSDRPGTYYNSTFLELTGGDQAHNNMQPSLGVNFIIKT